MLTTAAIIERLTRLKHCGLDLKCRYRLNMHQKLQKLMIKKMFLPLFCFFPAALDVSRDFRPNDEMLHVFSCL